MLDRSAQTKRTCNKCGRHGIVSPPWVLGDVLDISVMVIGQNPEFPDDGQLNPLVQGLSGVYLTNVVKCSSKKDCTRGNIRDCARLFLQYEIAFFDPLLIVCIGNVAENSVREIVPATHSAKVVNVKSFASMKQAGRPEDEINQYCDDVHAMIIGAIRSRYD